MKPVLSQFEVNPENGPTLPALEVDATTGLSHRPGVDTPFIEETLVALDRATASSEATYLTETKESADPDLVRMSASGNATFTKITRGGEDPQDPDILRAELSRAFALALGTTYTKQDLEGPDPDLVRM